MGVNSFSLVGLAAVGDVVVAVVVGGRVCTTVTTFWAVALSSGGFDTDFVAAFVAAFVEVYKIELGITVVVNS